MSVSVHLASSLYMCPFVSLSLHLCVFVGLSLTCSVGLQRCICVSLSCCGSVSVHLGVLRALGFVQTMSVLLYVGFAVCVGRRGRGGRGGGGGIAFLHVQVTYNSSPVHCSVWVSVTDGLGSTWLLLLGWMRRRQWG